jgi:hypothetical protein
VWHWRKLKAGQGGQAAIESIFRFFSFYLNQAHVLWRLGWLVKAVFSFAS